MTGSKADGVNITEIREKALGSLGGGEPFYSQTRLSQSPEIRQALGSP